MERWDMLTPRTKRDGGTHWHKVGAAFKGDKGINLVFDSLPLPDKEGRCVVSLFEPREPQSGGGGRGSQSRSNAFDDDSDGVPF